VTSFRSRMAWTAARRDRFVLIWGVLLLGGTTFVWSLMDSPVPVTPWFAALSAVMHLFVGALWGWIMWFFVHWLQRRTRVQP
jgi:hypothetical protein